MASGNYKVASDSDFTIGMGASDHDRLVEFQLDSPSDGSRGVLMFWMDRKTADKLSLHVNMNGKEVIKSLTLSGGTACTVHKVIPLGIPNDGTNKLYFWVDGGTGDVSIDDVVVFYWN